MKKTIIVLAIALFGLASCNKVGVEDIPAKNDIKLNLKVSDLDGAETKAVKTTWESGDAINIWFDSISDIRPDLVIWYNGATWIVNDQAAVSGKSPSASGKLNAVYCRWGLDDYMDYEMSDPWNIGFYVIQFHTKNDGIYTFDRWGLYPSRSALACFSTSDYSFDSETLTADISGWEFECNVQVVISGLPSNGKWAMGCDNLSRTNGFEMMAGGFMTNYSNGNDRIYYTSSMYNEDGEAFTYRSTTSSASATDFEFSLINALDGSEYRYTASGKSIENDHTKLKAIKIPFSKFTYYRTLEMVR